ncbi:MAG: hypothetical protein FWF79_03590 [Defluviitaleaceae bacterium]|nr:hypothetical protein [Defluviitaleaceae bacterium]
MVKSTSTKIRALLLAFALMFGAMPVTAMGAGLAEATSASRANPGASYGRSVPFNEDMHPTLEHWVNFIGSLVTEDFGGILLDNQYGFGWFDAWFLGLDFATVWDLIEILEDDVFSRGQINYIYGDGEYYLIEWLGENDYVVVFFIFEFWPGEDELVLYVGIDLAVSYHGTDPITNQTLTGVVAPVAGAVPSTPGDCPNWQWELHGYWWETIDGVRAGATFTADTCYELIIHIDAGAFWYFPAEFGFDLPPGATEIIVLNANAHLHDILITFPATTENGFGTVPSTGIANISAAMLAMFALMLASAALWGFVFFGTLRHRFLALRQKSCAIFSKCFVAE